MVQRLLAMVLLVYLACGYTLSQLFFERQRPDPRIATMFGLVAVVCYLLTLFWLWGGRDEMLGMERGLWIVVPWAALAVGFVCFLLIR